MPTSRTVRPSGRAVNGPVTALTPPMRRTDTRRWPPELTATPERKTDMFQTIRIARWAAPAVGAVLTALVLAVPTPSLAGDGAAGGSCVGDPVATSCGSPDRPVDWRVMMARVDAPAPRPSRPADWRRMLAEVDAPAPRPADESKQQGVGASTDDASLELVQIALGGVVGAGLVALAGALGARRRHHQPAARA